MEGRNEHLLINYLDRTLEEKEMREMEALINNDLETRKQWQYLQLAVEAVEYAALYDQVAAVKEQYKTIQPAEVLQAPQKQAVRIRMRRAFSVAAGLLLCVIGLGAYKYFTVSATQVYEKAFVQYTLSTTRSGATVNELEQAFRNKNWNTVIAALNRSSLTDNKALFLAGMAHLQLQQYAESNMLFEQVLANNAQTGDDYFQDEAEFYAAMSNLAGHKTREAIRLLKKIKADKDHLYNKQASQIGNIDLKILTLKAGK
ncbi:hypothetical protein FAM09_13345 [Niastella caeni]|uniref:Tetratricopeptide repeat protein n=1 Tax=Niastella caeni TaxID=2569763 RepID=A0A4S8HV46_9BACT|nr:hypothetical protein [Niastella caeni]THU39483.1 hypothetical protein FAM09_13345 [Niastella caeni]